MQITIEDISPVEKRVDFEVPWRDVAPKLDKAYDQLRREARLKGFRPGKVPRSLIEKMYKPQVEDDVARELVELSIGQAITENQSSRWPRPRSTSSSSSGRAVPASRRGSRSARQVAPKDYSGVELKRRPAKVTEEQVTKALEGYRRQLTQFEPVEGRAETAESDVAGGRGARAASAITRSRRTP